MGTTEGNAPELLVRAVADLGKFVDVPIALNAADMRPLTSMPHAGPVDGSRLAMLLGRPVTDDVKRRLVGDSGIFTGTAPQRIAPFPGLELGRVHLPVRDPSGQLVGHLWAIDRDDSVAESDWVRLQRAAAASLPGVLRDIRVTTTTRGLTVDQLISQHRSFRVLAVDFRIAPIMDPGGLVGFSVLDRVWERVREAIPQLNWCVTRDSEGREVLAVGGASGALHRSVLEPAVIEVIARVNDDTRAIGRAATFVSPPLFSPVEVLDHVDAIHSVAAAALGSTDVLFGDAVPAYELLVELGRIAPNQRLKVPHALRTLLTTDRGLTIARTAKTFLDTGGNAGRTATELGVHRGTLYYRIARIEEQTGFDLERGDHRVALHLGLTAAQIEGLL